MEDPVSALNYFIKGTFLQKFRFVKGKPFLGTRQFQQMTYFFNIFCKREAECYSLQLAIRFKVRFRTRRRTLVITSMLLGLRPPDRPAHSSATYVRNPSPFTSMCRYCNLQLQNALEDCRKTNPNA